MKQQIQTLNFTGQKDIDSDRVSISGFSGNSESYLALSKFDIEEYSFEPSAKVIIEVWATKYGLSRFDAGELHTLNSSTRFNIDIDANGMRSALVDINVVSTKPETRHKILGTVKRLRLAVDGRKVSILPHIERDLGGEVWRLDFDETDLPILSMNNRLENATGVVESTDFRAVVMPAVVEKIAEWLLDQQQEGNLEDPGIKKWEETFNILSCELPDLDNEEERKDYPTKVAQKFAEKHNFIERYLESLEAR